MFDLRTIFSPLASLRRRSSAAVLSLAVMALSQPAWADLPVQAAMPGVQQGDILGTWHAVIKIGVNVLILIIGALAFIAVASGALEKFRHYGKGKIELTDVKEFVVGGVTVLVVIVFLLTVANTIL